MSILKPGEESVAYNVVQFFPVYLKPMRNDESKL